MDEHTQTETHKNTHGYTHILPQKDAQAVAVNVMGHEREEQR